MVSEKWKVGQIVEMGCVYIGVYEGLRIWDVTLTRTMDYILVPAKGDHDWVASRRMA
jgi:hypothetical protein